MQMPVSIYSNLNEEYKVIVWEFDNSINDLTNSKKSEIFKDFIRKNIKEYTNSLPELFYDNNGKPYIKDKNYRSISISHTQNYLALQIHKKNKAGIDIEFPREKLLNVQEKFLSEEEMKMFANHLDLLHICWTAKEALFKIYGVSSVSLKHDIQILHIRDSLYITAQLIINDTIEQYQLFTHELCKNSLRITYVV